MILINEAKAADDYDIATNRTATVREFFQAAATAAGFKPQFSGDGVNEACVCSHTNLLLCSVNSKYFRPSDVNYLRGDYSKIERELGWKPTTSLEEMTQKMVDSDIENALSGLPTAF